MYKDVFFKTSVLKNIAKITVKQLCRRLFLIMLLPHSKYFTGDCFSNFLELWMVFGPIKNIVKNVYISLKTKSYSKEKSNCEITWRAGVRGCVP